MMANKGEQHRKITKNLEQEVEIILSQDEGDSETTMLKENKSVEIKATPSSRICRTEGLNMPVNTPRRSARKSIKPAQDYEEIINKTCLKANKENEGEDENELEHNVELMEPKWTPAKVGRVSQKRGRKSRKVKSAKKIEDAGEITERLEEIPCEGHTVTSDANQKLDEHAPLEQEKKMYVLPTSEENPDEPSTCEENPDEPSTCEENPDESSTCAENPDGPPTSKENPDEPPTSKENPDEPSTGEENPDEPSAFEEKPDKPSTSEENPDDPSTCEENVDLLAISKNDANILPASKENEAVLLSSEKNASVPQTSEKHASVAETNNSNVNVPPTSEAGLIEVKREEYSVAIDSETQRNQTINNVKTTQNLHTSGVNSDTFGYHLKTKDINVSDLGLKPIEDDQAEADVMESLQISDDESETENNKIVVPKVVLTDSNGLSNTVLSTPCATIDVDSDDGDRIFEAEQYVYIKDVTPKQEKRSKPYRFPTPYKPKSTFTFGKDECNERSTTPTICDKKEQALEPETIMSTTFTTLEPKEIVIRSIRKRSLSVSVPGRDNAKKLAKMERPINRVTFHSPANQTAVIEELDLLIANSVKKSNEYQVEKNLNVTQRRKRSMSLDEASMGRVTKLPRPVPGSASRKIRDTPQKPTQTRTKLPNFAAIHQKQFNKMENLVDHVARKVERAKILTNSAIKNAALKSMQTTTPTKKAANINKTTAAVALAALQPVASKITPIKIIRHTSNENKDGELFKKLPNPRLAIIKPMSSLNTISKPLVAKNITQTQKPMPKQLPAQKVVKPTQTRSKAIKPTFNLSTLLTTNASNPTAAITQKLLNSTFHTVTTAAAPALDTIENKTETRRQRHMDMFKSRTASTRNLAEKNSAVIRGVRSNRRFDLQMQHRKNMEHN